MKRILLLAFVLVALVTAGAFAQTTGVRSIENQVTQNLFGNELDASLTVQETGNKPDFSELNSNYLFGGIGNLNELANRDVVFTATPGDPLWLGFHNAQGPWSLFVATYLDGTGTENVNEVALATAPGTDADGNPVEWVSQEEIFEGDGKLFGRYVQEAQFIMPLLGMNIGLGVELDVINNRDAGDIATSIAAGGGGESVGAPGGGDSYTYTNTGFTNTASPPAPEADWSETITSSDANGSFTSVSVAVPVFLDGEMSHLIVPTIEFEMTNNSYSYSESYENGPSAPFAGQTFDVDSEEVTARTGILRFLAPYELVTAGFGDNPANEFIVGATPRLTMGFGTLEDSATAVNTTFPGGGGAATENSTTVVTNTSDYSSALGFGLEVSAGNSFYFEPAPVVEFGVQPTGYVSFDSNPNSANYQIVSSRSSVTTLDGTETANTTTTYENSDGGSVFSRDLVLGFGVLLSTGLTIEPNNLPFKIMMGATPSINARIDWITSQQGTQTVTDSIADTSSTTIVGDSSTERTINYTVASNHGFGLGFDFAENVRFDVLLSGANLFEFDSLVMQGVIALD